MHAQLPPAESSFNYLNQAPSAQEYIPSLSVETRATLDTSTTAFHLGRKPQTLRGWASSDSGPARPLRINGRRAWPVAALQKLLGACVSAQPARCPSMHMRMVVIERKREFRPTFQS